MVKILSVKALPCNYDKIQGLIYADINGEREELTTPLFRTEKALKTYIRKKIAILKKSVI